MRSCLIAFGLGCWATVTFPQQRGADDAQIRAQIAAYETAVNAHNAPDLAALYTEDGDLILYDSPRVTGREAISQFAAGGWAAQSPTLRIAISVTSVRYLSPDLAIVETVARFNEGDVRENRGTSVMVRRGRTWLHAALRVFAAQRP